MPFIYRSWYKRLKVLDRLLILLSELVNKLQQLHKWFDNSFVYFYVTGALGVLLVWYVLQGIEYQSLFAICLSSLVNYCLMLIVLKFLTFNLFSTPTCTKLHFQTLFVAVARLLFDFVTLVVDFSILYISSSTTIYSICVVHGHMCFFSKFVF